MEKFILDRSKPPASGTPKDLKFPKFDEIQTSNGIKVLVVQDSRLPLISTSILFKKGIYFDSYYGKEYAGLGSRMSELLTKGTRRYNAEQLSERVDYLGAMLNTNSNFDSMSVTGLSLSKNFDELFEIISEIILEPTFTDDEINREIEKKINEVVAYKDDCEYLCSLLFNKVIYGEQPYAYPIYGTEESLPLLTRDLIVQHYSDMINPGEMIIAFIGDISKERSLEIVDKYFSALEKKEKVNSVPVIELSPKPGVFLTNKVGAVQSSFKIGHRGAKKMSEDFLKLKFMNTILGGSFTSRINHNLREVNGYTYGARSYFTQRKYSGDFSIETEVKNDLTAAACIEILKELKKFKNEKITDEELNLTKNYIAGNFPLQMETPQSIASLLINLRLYDMDADFYDRYVSEIMNMTADDVLKTAQKYIHPEEVSFCLAGNVDEIKEDMKQLGEVEVISV